MFVYLYIYIFESLAGLLPLRLARVSSLCFEQRAPVSEKNPYTVTGNGNSYHTGNVVKEEKLLVLAFKIKHLHVKKKPLIKIMR